jgi:hypothetical protein
VQIGDRCLLQLKRYISSIGHLVVPFIFSIMARGAGQPEPHIASIARDQRGEPQRMTLVIRFIPRR